MTDRERIEQEIRDVLERESQAIPLSERLFSPEGLFSRLASTEEERRLLVQSPLFKQAQRRFSALQRVEAERFAQLAEHMKTALPEVDYVLKLERAEIT